MLEFKLNNKHLLLDLNAGIKVVWKNPACNFKDFPGDVGLGVDIPVNDVNRNLFGSPERFEKHASENKRSFPGFEVRWAGYLLISGTFIMQSASHDKYSGWLRSFTGDLGTKQRDRFISESYSFSKQKDFENKATYSPDTDEYACPVVVNPSFFAEKGEKTNVERLRVNPTYMKKIYKKVAGIRVPVIDYNQFISETVEVEDYTEAFLKHGGYWVNARTGPGGPVKTEATTSKALPDNIVRDLKVTVVSPMLYLNYVIKTLFKDNGIAIIENFLEDDPDLKNLVIYNNFDITETKFMFTQLFLAKYYWEDQLPEYIENLRASGQYAEDIFREVKKFTYKDLLPEIRLKDFIMSVQNMLNVFLHFVPGRKQVSILDRDKILELPAIDIEKYMTGFWEINEKQNNTLKFSFEQDDSDMLIARRWQDITEYRNKEKDAVDTIAELEAIGSPEMDEIRFVREANAYYQYKLWLLEWDNEETGEHRQDKYIGWDYLSTGFQNAYFNRGQDTEEEIKTEFSTLHGATRAMTEQKGNIRTELFAFESFAPRLIFNLPSQSGCYKTDNISLDWEDEQGGLLKSRWHNWPRFWATRLPVASDAHFPMNVLDYVIRNIYRKFRAREGEFIIEQMETEFRLNYMSQTKITGHKIDYLPRSLTLLDSVTLDEFIWVDWTIIIDALKMLNEWGYKV